MKTLRYTLAAIWLSAAAAQAKPYTIDHAASQITFAGTHADKPFEGSFERWEASIDFDAENLTASKITARFDPASAKTGNSMYDGTLPQADWFDIKQHSRAEFVSNAITASDGGGYLATGDLSIRGITQPVTFAFTLSDPATSPIKATGSFVIDRLAFDIGKKSDPEAEWVGKQITVTLDITATIP